MEHEASGRLATVRLQRDEAGVAPVLVDLLFASCGIEPEIVHSARPLAGLLSRPTPLARADHLIALKLLARDGRRRPQDGIDLCALLETANDEELNLARGAVRLIEARGFHRGRALSELLETAIRERR